MRLPLLPVLLCSLALAGLSACVPLAAVDNDFGAEPSPVSSPDRGGASDGDCYENTAGGCIAATPGCSPDDIAAEEGGVVCATCEAGGVAVDICGEPRVARCFDLESPGGGACQRCVTDDGEVLYDDCADFTDDAEGLTCETVVRGDTGAGGEAPPANGAFGCASDADCGEGYVCLFTANAGEGTCTPLSEGVECEVCTNESGQVVRETCRPDADSCEEVVEADGRVCTECRLNGELAWRECTGGDLDPRVCEVYGDGQGRCIDCYGAADELLSHDCTGGAADPSAGFCDVEVLPGGLSCRTCYDSNGAVLFEECEASTEPLRCEELVFTDQTCVVCVDDTGSAAYTECRRNGCTSGDDCPPPAACEVRYGADGSLCRLCPVEGTGQMEQRCMSGGDLFCYFEDQFSEPIPDDDGDADGAPPPEAEVCLVCIDAEDRTEVHRSCGATDGGAAPAPVVCMPSTTSAGAPCEICYDSSTGAEVYSSCGEGDVTGQCVEVAGLELVGSQGQSLFLPVEVTGGATDVPAVVDCLECAATDPSAYGASAQCTLRPECGDEPTDPSAPPPPPCGSGAVSYRYATTQCSDPWGASAGAAGASGVMAWFLEQHGVVVWSALYEEVAPAEDCASCDCLDGGMLLVDVDPAHAELLTSLGFAQ